MIVLTAIRCPHCGRVIGETDGPRLFVGGGICRRVVTLECQGRQVGNRVFACPGWVTWKPSERQAVVASDVLTAPA